MLKIPLWTEQFSKPNNLITSESPNSKTDVLIIGGGYTGLCAARILKQNGAEVWPQNFAHLDNKKSANIYNNNTGHFNAITAIVGPPTNPAPIQHIFNFFINFYLISMRMIESFLQDHR